MGTVVVAVVAAVIVFAFLASVALARRQLKQRRQRTAQANQTYPLVFIVGISSILETQLMIAGQESDKPEIQPPPPAYCS